MGKQLTLIMTWMHCYFYNTFHWILPCKRKIFCLQFMSIRITNGLTLYMHNMASQQHWRHLASRISMSSQKEPVMTEYHKRRSWERRKYNHCWSDMASFEDSKDLNSDLIPNAFTMPMYCFVGYTGAGHIIRISSKSWFISLIPFKKWNLYNVYIHSTQTDIFQVFISFNFDDYKWQLMKTPNSVSQKIRILWKGSILKTPGATL